jgi:hypothetical protein
MTSDSYPRGFGAHQVFKQPVGSAAGAAQPHGTPLNCFTSPAITGPVLNALSRTPTATGPLPRDGQRAEAHRLSPKTSPTRTHPHRGRRHRGRSASGYTPQRSVWGRTRGLSPSRRRASPICPGARSTLKGLPARPLRLLASSGNAFDGTVPAEIVRDRGRALPTNWLPAQPSRFAGKLKLTARAHRVLFPCGVHRHHHD